MNQMNSNTNCLIIAGEKSGEEHAESFLPQLIEKNPHIHFFGVGGDYFKGLGIELFYHIKDFAAMGISEVLTKLFFYIEAEKKILQEVALRNCKSAILIDFQGFNLRLAKKLKKQGVKVLYYVAPQAWAWKSHRAKTVGDSVYSLFSIIPFEKKWFAQRGTNKIISVPHPLYLKYREELTNISKKNDLSSKPYINLLLLPGSRNSEVKSLLPIYIEACKELQKEFNLKISIVRTESVDQRWYEEYNHFISTYYNSEELTKALKEADLCLATSGTVTLACALFEVPTIVCYKTTLLNWFLYSQFVRYKGFVSLGNIVNEEEIFPELLQDEVNSYILVQKLKRWLSDSSFYSQTIKKLEATKSSLTGEDINVSDYMGEVISENR